MIPLAPRPFGTTGLSVSPLGFGAGAIGDPALDDHELAARFAAHTPGVSSAIIGTRSLAHLGHNAELVEQGGLPPAVFAAVRARWAGRRR